MIDCNLWDAVMEREDFDNAWILQSNLGKTKAKGARFRNANLEGASFIFSDLTKTDLRDSNLKKADLGHALLVGANFEWEDLTGTKIDH